MWIDNPDYSKVGTVGFLVCVSYEGRDRRSLRDRPARTNRSGVPMLDGWCGETDNRSVVAEGCARIVGTNRLGDRARLEKLTGEELATFLDGEGYPELVPPTGGGR